jgi:lysozyme
VDWKEREAEEILLDEGLKLRAYRDTVGVPTIGVGHTKGVKDGDIITKKQAIAFLREDMEDAIEDAKSLCLDWENMSGPRKGVMVNMAFNLGRDRLSGFKNTLRFINERNYARAATNMLLSKWARQVKGRADRLAYRMMHNEYAAR